MDTIFAVSSGAPPAAIAVMRISGARAFAAVQQLAGDVPPARQAALRILRDAHGDPLDQALVLVFPGPRSATGEDLAELHLHGGRAVVRAVAAALDAIDGLRPAEAGEFTRRALLNGRLDLTAAEGLGDLLMAETEAQRRAAIRTAGGAVRRHAEDWTVRLLGIAARIEAELDHGDEDDVAGADPMPGLRAAADILGRDIAGVASRPPVERLRDGLRVVLGGPPNAGKSTLLNALAERDAAIVSPIAGTTRDRIEVPVVREGVAWLFVDTAGLAEATDDPIEAIGVARARDALAEADLLLWLGDDAPPAHPCALWVHARADAADRPPPHPAQIRVSVHAGMGMDMLWQRMAALAHALLPPPDLVVLNARQRDWCLVAVEALGRAAALEDPLLFAEELRAARRALDAITGRAGVEDVLDALFGKFCIGK